VLHTHCPHHYRFGNDGESETEFSSRLASSLRELIEREGPDTIAAMIAEPVMGAGGVIVPPSGYFSAIQEVLDEHDILLIDDEVINGFGRTGNWWGCQTVGMAPTTISAAKQLTAAYAPLGAVLVPEEIYQACLDNSAAIGTFGHGFTYGGHPLSCALGVKAIEIYQRRDIIGHVRTLIPIFDDRLRRVRDHPLVGEVRSCGLLGGVELVANKRTRRSFESKHAVAAQLCRFLEGHGAILRALGDTVAFCPPMIISEAELHELFDRFEKALAETEAWVHQKELRLE
jgi:4-aminobutyrate--pyruvate transaminase